MPRTINLALVPGDGIGAEVVPEAQRVIEAVLPSDVKLEVADYDLGAGRYLASGEILPDSVVDELRQTDAILLGAVGDPRVPPGVLERGMLLRLRFEFEHYVNLRPVRLYPGVPCPLVGAEPDDIDMIVVREGTEGPYVGGGGVLRKGTPQEVATQDSYNTAFGVERVARYAFKRAKERARKHLTLVHKTNVLSYAGDLWKRTVDRLAADYPEVTVEYQHVDAASMFFVSDPQRFDVVVTDNLFGDILTDLGAAIAGGIGLAASGNVNPEGDYPSMFEPVHGSAPDIAGQGKADPTATILSGALLLEHLGYPELAQRIEWAVGRDIAERGSEWQARSTQEVGMDIAELAAAN